jgi:hypothetical protein
MSCTVRNKFHALVNKREIIRFRRVRKIAKSDFQFPHSVLLSVCPSAWNISAPTGQIIMKFSLYLFFEDVH